MVLIQYFKFNYASLSIVNAYTDPIKMNTEALIYCSGTREEYHICEAKQKHIFTYPIDVFFMWKDDATKCESEECNEWDGESHSGELIRSHPIRALYAAIEQCIMPLSPPLNNCLYVIK